VKIRRASRWHFPMNLVSPKSEFGSNDYWNSIWKPMCWYLKYNQFKLLRRIIRFYLKDITTLKTSLLRFEVCHYLRNMVWVSHLNTDYSMRYRRLKICVRCHRAEVGTAAYVLCYKVSRLTQQFQSLNIKFFKFF